MLANSLGVGNLTAATIDKRQFRPHGIRNWWFGSLIDDSKRDNQSVDATVDGSKSCETFAG